MTLKNVQSAPKFNGSLQNPMSAQIYYLKAKQAYANNQWQEGCAFAQACIDAARQDEKLRFFAKELLAVGLLKVDQVQLALAIFVELNQLQPNNVVNINNMGLALMHLQRYQDAIRCFQRARELTPENVDFHMSLALAFYKNTDFAHAKMSYQAAAHLAPSLVEARVGIAWSLQADGHIDEAMDAYEQVLDVESTHLVTLNNMIFIQYYLYPIDMKRQMMLLQRFGEGVSSGEPSCIQTGSLSLQANEPLRIGFVSADFRDHPVGSFLESTIEQLNSVLRSKVTLLAYYNHLKEDDYTQQLRNLFDQWESVVELSDDALIKQIKRDKVDILIDLSGHTRGSRLSVFAKRAAPLQVSWLGYWGSTGLSNMDYVLADPVSVPANEECWFLEKVWRLPHLRYCFSIPRDAPEVRFPPCIQNQKIIFGCYQHLIKINNTVLNLWSTILAACPEASLRIQSHDFAKDELKKRFVERMVQVGLDIERVDLVGGMSTKEYLASYLEVDVLLDTFPYPGGTTTAEALWMGVPTLTFATPSMLGRQGEAMLVSAGLSDWVAYSEEEYVQKAITWGNADLEQRKALASLRAGMREQVRQSPVFNAKQFAGEFVDALYGMWHEKCGV